MAEEPNKEFLGVGWTFPVATGAAGEIEMSAYEQDIHQAIHIILGTSPGERLMRPDFGAGLRALVFEPLNTTTKALVRQRVEQALVLWEPRIDNVTVKVDHGDRNSQLSIEIKYRIRATNTFYNLVYPFYLLEGDPV